MSPGKIDIPVVRRHLLAIDAVVQTLRAHQGRPLGLLERDVEERWVIERGLQLCAQNALDVATHLAAAAGLDVPDYAAAISRLVELDILRRDFGEKFRSVAGFRNVVVHGYLDVDIQLLHRLLNQRLDDFAEFANHVSSYIASQPET